MQPLHRDPVQGGVVQHHHGVRVQRQALQGEQAVVGLHHHIAGLVLVGEHAAQQGLRLQGSGFGVQGWGAGRGCVGIRRVSAQSACPLKRERGAPACLHL